MKIFDTSSVVCIFSEIKYPKIFEICKEYGYQLCITPQVYDEITQNPETFQHLKGYGDINIVNTVDGDCYTKLSKRYPWMHKGEISVLCAGLSKKGSHERYYCIIDERARKLRDKLHVRVTGTVGLILWQKSLSALTKGECQDLYNKFLQSEFWIKKDIIQGLLK